MHDNDDTRPDKVTYIAGSQFVNVYLTDRAYGGPEEGGWWYDYGKLIRSTQAAPTDLPALKAQEDAWCAEENAHRRSDISSVLSEGRYVTYIEDTPGEDYPAQTPHYE